METQNESSGESGAGQWGAVVARIAADIPRWVLVTASVVLLCGALVLIVSFVLMVVWVAKGDKVTVLGHTIEVTQQVSQERQAATVKYPHNTLEWEQRKYLVELMLRPADAIASKR